MGEHAVAAEDLRALAEVGPFDTRTRDLLERAADLLDDTCNAEYLRWDGTRWSCTFPAGHPGDHYGQTDLGFTWWSPEASIR